MYLSGFLYLLEQFSCALSLLCAVSRAARLRFPSLWQLLLCALLTALSSLAAALYPSLLLRLGALLLCCLSPWALWPTLPRRLRRMLPPMLFLLTLLYAGIVRFIHQLSLPAWLCMLLSSLSLPLLLCLPAQSIPSCITIEIRCGITRMEITALIDSGNLLRDPLTTQPVVVISRRAAHRLIPPPAPGQLNSGLRQIPIRTVAGPSSMIVFRPDALRILHNGVWQNVQAMAGIAPSGYDGVQALAPASLLHASSLTYTQGGSSP